MQDPWVAGRNFVSFPSNFFTQPFHYFHLVKVVDCLSSWYKFIMNKPSNISSRTLFADYVVWISSLSIRYLSLCLNPLIDFQSNLLSLQLFTKLESYPSQPHTLCHSLGKLSLLWESINVYLGKNLSNLKMKYNFISNSAKLG